MEEEEVFNLTNSARMGENSCNMLFTAIFGGGNFGAGDGAVMDDTADAGETASIADGALVAVEPLLASFLLMTRRRTFI